jgi:hypothetical protein
MANQKIQLASVCNGGYGVININPAKVANGIG